MAREKGVILVDTGPEIKRKAFILKEAFGFKSVRELIISLIEEKWQKQEGKK